MTPDLDSPGAETNPWREAVLGVAPKGHKPLDPPDKPRPVSRALWRLFRMFLSSTTTRHRLRGLKKSRNAAARKAAIKRPGWSVPRLAVWGAGLAFTPALAVIVIFVSVAVNMPQPNLDGLVNEETVIKVLARDGSLLAQRGSEHHAVSLAKLPRHVIDAVVATEDARFFRHWGVDIIGLSRAMLANMRAGRYVQGGSTITQQLAKNLFLAPDRKLKRKIQEMMLALWLEWHLSKTQILELYLNRVYLGAGAHGLSMAADRYFGKQPEHLTLAEAAVLAGLLKAPTRYAPTGDTRRTMKRARVVLGRMRSAGFITAAVEARTASHPVIFKTGPQRIRSRGAGYAADWIFEALGDVVGPLSGKLIVRTTIDRELQNRAQSIVQRTIDVDARKRGAEQAAVVVLENTGEVRAIVGGVSHAASQFNRAVRAQRQPGSAFKPFVYLAGLEAGFTPESTAFDEPVEVDGWAPKNSSDRYHGRTTLREALANSYNTVAVRLMIEAGVANTVRVARKLGISSPLHNKPSLALGTAEVSPFELTSAYLAFANGGHRPRTHVIQEVTTAAGKVLFSYKRRPARTVISPADVSNMNEMLASAVVAGTGRRAAIPPHPAAGKTGTSQDFRDAWFVGFTGSMTAGVWVGNDRARSMERVTGGDLPARIWSDVMLAAHDGRLPRPLAGSYAARIQALRERLSATSDLVPAPAGGIAGLLAAQAAMPLDVAESNTDASPARRTGPLPPVDPTLLAAHPASSTQQSRSWWFSRSN